MTVVDFSLWIVFASFVVTVSEIRVVSLGVVTVVAAVVGGGLHISSKHKNYQNQ